MGKDGAAITVVFDPATDLINMQATVPTGSYASWGWGHDMKDTEIVFFSADGKNSEVTFWWSKDDDTPDKDNTYAPCYDTSFTEDGDMINFIATRPLDCQIKNTYVVQLDKNLELCVAWNPDDPSMSDHDDNTKKF